MHLLREKRGKTQGEDGWMDGWHEPFSFYFLPLTCGGWVVKENNSVHPIPPHPNSTQTHVHHILTVPSPAGMALPLILRQFIIIIIISVYDKNASKRDG